MLKQDRRYQLQIKKAGCFLFDLDGTLIDSTPCHERAFVQALDEVDNGLARAFVYERFKGRGTREVFTDLGFNSSDLVARLVERKQGLYRQMLYEGQVLAFPGAFELLGELRNLGRRLMVVTGASRRSAEAALARLDLAQFFEGLVTGEDVERTKPSPDAYLKCLRLHTVGKNDAVAIEDALSGIEAARAAGLEVIAVNNSDLSHLPEYAGTLRDLHRLLTDDA